MVFHMVPTNLQSWDQHPDYVEMCRTLGHAGEANAYAIPRDSGSGTNVTSFKYGGSYWSPNSLPSIMYMLWPCTAWLAWKNVPKPAQKRDRNGQLMFERYPRSGQAPRKILDWPVLRGIDKISTEVQWWFVELLFRLEPRLKWADLDMLMEWTGDRRRYVRNTGFINLIQMRCLRGRDVWAMMSWRDKAGRGANGRRAAVTTRLTAAQVAGNTTVGITPGVVAPAQPAAPVVAPVQPPTVPNVLQSTSAPTSAPANGNIQSIPRPRRRYRNIAPNNAPRILPSQPQSQPVSLIPSDYRDQSFSGSLAPPSLKRKAEAAPVTSEKRRRRGASMLVDDDGYTQASTVASPSQVELGHSQQNGFSRGSFLPPYNDESMMPLPGFLQDFGQRRQHSVPAEYHNDYRRDLLPENAPRDGFGGLFAVHSTTNFNTTPRHHNSGFEYVSRHHNSFRGAFAPDFATSNWQPMPTRRYESFVDEPSQGFSSRQTLEPTSWAVYAGGPDYHQWEDDVLDSTRPLNQDASYISQYPAYPLQSRSTSYRPQRSPSFSGQ